MEWVLRVAVAGEFIGHGVFALRVEPDWIPFFTALGFSAETAKTFLPLIGMLDIALALHVLVFPVRAALLWMTCWGFWTALLRPIAGHPIWAFVERWPNWGAPFALLLLLGWPKTLKAWWRR